MCEVSGADYMDHMCENVGMPPLQETPPPLHLPTPRPAPSIFHEMMVRYCFYILNNKNVHSVFCLEVQIKGEGLAVQSTYTSYQGGANPLQGQLKGGCLENRDFLGPNGIRFARCLKSLDYQGPPFPITRVMDLPSCKSLRSAPNTVNIMYINSYRKQMERVEWGRSLGALVAWTHSSALIVCQWKYED